MPTVLQDIGEEADSSFKWFIIEIKEYINDKYFVSNFKLLLEKGEDDNRFSLEKQMETIMYLLMREKVHQYPLINCVKKTVQVWAVPVSKKKSIESIFYSLERIIIRMNSKNNNSIKIFQRKITQWSYWNW